MQTLKRAIDGLVQSYIRSNDTKILFIWGPRRSGKTTLLDRVGAELRIKKFNFDLISDREKFVASRDALGKIAKENPIVLIDEVQNYPEATIMLKLLHDEFGVKIIATGSSELRQKASQEFDTLAGRFNEIFCLPLSIPEIVANESPRASDLESFSVKLAKYLQVWGSYPEVYLGRSLPESDRIDLLQRMLDTYVLKDVIDIYELKNQKLAKDILTKIALQLGSEVSIREIASSLGAYPSTVSNYIEVFVRNYILIPLPSFKTNIRRAVSENRKLYFYDLGIRNILIKDFREVELRQDRGGLFENFIILELEKLRKITNAKMNFYFYREYGGKEVDLIIEDYKKKYTAVEIKASGGELQNIFPLANTQEVITSQNYFARLTAILPSPSIGRLDRDKPA